jgi:hypothetical protein
MNLRRWWGPLLALPLALGAPKHHQNRDRAYRSKKRECEASGPCAGRDAAVAANCVNACISPACFEAVYAEEPLEDGEVDAKRSRSFLGCVRKEAAAKRADDRKARKAKRKRDRRGEEA